VATLALTRQIGNIAVAKQFAPLSETHQNFIARQHIFFVASTAANTHVNVSPRPTTEFRVINPTTVAYLDKTGSGNETAAHIRAGGKLTVMFCAFEGPPLILRLYGTGLSHRLHSTAYTQMLEHHFNNTAPPGARQIVQINITLVQSSCGYGVPRFTYDGERDGLDRWAEAKGPDGVEAYRREKNSLSLDGLPTGAFED
jgi:hypothetical protein